MESGPTLTEITVLDHLRSRLAELLIMDTIPDDFDLIDSGALNSSMFLALFVELEEEFDIHVTAADMKPDNFRTLDLIARFVCAKRTGS
jgi:betaine-aldehyde dehydrogenase